jgi:hypothetical protein
MVRAYWRIGQIIVEDEQNGTERANYGEQQLQKLSARLTVEFGKNFDVSNLRRMRRFYLCFQIQDTLCPELSWSICKSSCWSWVRALLLWHVSSASVRMTVIITLTWFSINGANAALVDYQDYH